MTAFLLALVLTSPLILTAGLWLFCIRPYLRRCGKAVITGANWGQSAMGDWSLARITAKDRGENPWFLRAFPLSFLWWPASVFIVYVLTEAIG